MRASAPLTGAGTTTSPLALAPASASNDGYLSAADYARFDTRPALLFRRHLTAEWLNTNAQFGSARTRAMTGSRLDFSVGSVVNERLFEVPIVPANTMSSSREYLAHVKVWTTDLTADNDLTAVLCDSTRCAGLFRYDGANSSLGTGLSGLYGVTLQSQTTGSAGGDTSTTQRVFELDLVLGATTRVLASADPTITPVAWVSDRTLVRTEALRLVFFANDPTERYGFSSVEITLEENR